MRANITFFSFPALKVVESQRNLQFSLCDFFRWLCVTLILDFEKEQNLSIDDFKEGEAAV